MATGPGGGYATADMQACPHAAYPTSRELKPHPPTVEVESVRAPGRHLRESLSLARGSGSIKEGGPSE